MAFRRLKLSGARLAMLAVAASAFALSARAQEVPPSFKLVQAPAATGATPSSAPTATTQQPYGDPTPPASPLNPFFATMSVLNSSTSVGTSNGQLNVTSIIITNFDSTAQQVILFQPLFASGGKCGDPVIGGTSPSLQVYVQPSQTLVMPFPTPIVFKGQKTNCFAAQVTTLLHGGSAQVNVTGYYQKR